MFSTVFKADKPKPRKGKKNPEDDLVSNGGMPDHTRPQEGVNPMVAAGAVGSGAEIAATGIQQGMPGGGTAF